MKKIIYTLIALSAFSIQSVFGSCPAGQSYVEIQLLDDGFYATDPTSFEVVIGGVSVYCGNPALDGTATSYQSTSPGGATFYVVVSGCFNEGDAIEIYYEDTFGDGVAATGGPVTGILGCDFLRPNITQVQPTGAGGLLKNGGGGLFATGTVSSDNENLGVRDPAAAGDACALAAGNAAIMVAATAADLATADSDGIGQTFAETTNYPVCDVAGGQNVDESGTPRDSNSEFYEVCGDFTMPNTTGNETGVDITVYVGSVELAILPAGTTGDDVDNNGGVNDCGSSLVDVSIFDAGCGPLVASGALSLEGLTPGANYTICVTARVDDIDDRGPDNMTGTADDGVTEADGTCVLDGISIGVQPYNIIPCDSEASVLMMSQTILCPGESLDFTVTGAMYPNTSTLMDNTDDGDATTGCYFIDYYTTTVPPTPPNPYPGGTFGDVFDRFEPAGTDISATITNNGGMGDSNEDVMGLPANTVISAVGSVFGDGCTVETGTDGAGGGCGDVTDYQEFVLLQPIAASAAACDCSGGGNPVVNLSGFTGGEPSALAAIGAGNFAGIDNANYTLAATGGTLDVTTVGVGGAAVLTMDTDGGAWSVTITDDQGCMQVINGSCISCAPPAADCSSYSAETTSGAAACSDQPLWLLTVPLDACPGTVSFCFDITSDQFTSELFVDVLNGANAIVASPITVGQFADNTQPGNICVGPLASVDGPYTLFVGDDFGDGNGGSIIVTDTNNGNGVLYTTTFAGATSPAGTFDLSPLVVDPFSTMTMEWYENGAIVETEANVPCQNFSRFYTFTTTNVCKPDAQNAGYVLTCDLDGTIVASNLNIPVDVYPPAPGAASDLVMITYPDDPTGMGGCGTPVITYLADCSVDEVTVSETMTPDVCGPATTVGDITAGTAQFSVSYTGATGEPDCCSTAGPLVPFAENVALTDQGPTSQFNGGGSLNADLQSYMNVFAGCGTATTGLLSLNVTNIQFPAGSFLEPDVPPTAATPTGATVEDFFLTIYINGAIIFDGNLGGTGGFAMWTLDGFVFDLTAFGFDGDDLVEVSLYPNGLGATYIDDWTADLDWSIDAAYQDCQTPSAVNCDFTLDVPYSCACLPVELLYVEGEAQGAVNVINWATATELDNSHFEVERSVDGQKFVAIGKVDGAGTTVEEQRYEFVDVTPFSVGYYRLKQVDFDGTFDYSEVVVINREENTKGIVEVFPIPTHDNVTVQYETASNADVTFTVTDVLGRIISKETVGAAEGLNTYSVDMTAQATGLYFITYSDGVLEQTRRVIKN